MSKVDQALHRAAEETRQAAMRRRPAPLETQRRAHRQGWLTFAAAFALVVMAFGLVPLLAGIGEPAPPVGGTTPPPEPVVTSTIITVTTFATEPAGSCPSLDQAVPQPVEGLPEAVAETRDAIVAAARSCDLELLERLAGERFSSSFGGAGSENLSIWNDKGLEPTVTLLDLLDMSHATIPGPAGDIYVWPAAYSYETWEQVTEEEMDELARIHSEGEFDSFGAAGTYLGWRTGISENGEWMFFIAGD
jgi:hypothetical protein